MCPFSPNHSPRFRKPPYDPTRSVFPSAVLTLAYPPAAFPKPKKLKCWRIYTPLDAGLHAGLGLATELLPSLVGSTRPPGAQSPFARYEVLPPAVWRPAASTTSEGITPPSSLIQAHAPDQIPPTGFGSTSSGGSLQVVASPCWEMALPDVISAILTQVPGPLPRDVLPVHMLISSRQTTASRKD